MDENRLLELPQESFRPMIAQSVQLEQFLGEELIFCFRDLDGVHTFTTCYGDIYKTVNALRDYRAGRYDPFHAIVCCSQHI